MLQLAIVEQLVQFTKSLRRKRQLSMNLLRTVTNTRYRVCYNFKFPEQLPHRGSNCARRFLQKLLARFASRDLKRESRWLSVELNCIE